MRSPSLALALALALALGLAPALALGACAHEPVSDEVTADAPTTIEPDGLPEPDFCNATDPRAEPIAIHVTPEAGEQPYVDALAAATTSIDVQIYLMGYGGILDQLEAKARAGVEVRVIFDQSKKDTNMKYFTALRAAGAEVMWSDPRFTYQHSKFFVVDGKVAVISTGNYSKAYSIDLERNHVAVDRDRADLIDLATLFEADWAGVTPAMPCTRLVISPINARSRILDLVTSATRTLTIESMQLADRAVRDAVKARVEAGVDVRVLLADTDWIDANASAVTFLKNLGVTVKWIPHLHTKVIVADGVRAYLGSENLSQTSLDRNREVGVVVTDPSSIEPLATSFEADWAVATTF